MTVTNILLYIYSAIVIIGGVIGYTVAGSVPSLFMGILTGSALVLGISIMASGYTAGYYVTLVTVIFLSVFFLHRFTLTFAIMPAGLMFVLSLLALLLLIKSHK